MEVSPIGVVSDTDAQLGKTVALRPIPLVLSAAVASHRGPLCSGRLGQRRLEVAHPPAQVRVGGGQDRTASRPALRALPIPTVATGTPAGICTIDSSESIPSRCFSGTGTPITGNGVTAASIPGRCAAPPAPGDDHLEPTSSASRP
jgi:hypothetical protein